MEYIKENLKSVKERISRAEEKSGRQNGSVTLIAVSKTYPPELINEAIENGVTDIGENRVQELMEKYDKVKSVRWHLIGHLQKNKVKYIIDKIALIHSVDSLALAEEINKQAKKIGKIQEILLEVNVSGEKSKFGLTPKDCLAAAEEISKLENVRIRGLMTVAPNTDDEELLRSVFSGLKQISLDIKENLADTIDMSILSMGMTNDFPIAIECGATMVRVGTGIFGKRSALERGY